MRFYFWKSGNSSSIFNLDFLFLTLLELTFQANFNTPNLPPDLVILWSIMSRFMRYSRMEGGDMIWKCLSGFIFTLEFPCHQKEEENIVITTHSLHSYMYTNPSHSLGDMWMVGIHDCPNRCSEQGDCRHGYCEVFIYRLIDSWMDWFFFSFSVMMDFMVSTVLTPLVLGIIVTMINSQGWYWEFIMAIF